MMCVDVYLSFALVFYQGDAGTPAGICYRERATCAVAAMAAGRAFALTASDYVPRCVPQPPTPAAKRRR
jgi:hypothetical protein